MLAVMKILRVIARTILINTSIFFEAVGLINQSIFLASLASKTGDAVSKIEYGALLLQYGSQIDRRKAIEIFEGLVDCGQGLALAHANLCYVYCNGVGVDPDQKLGEFHCKQAFENGFHGDDKSMNDLYKEITNEKNM